MRKFGHDVSVKPYRLPVQTLGAGVKKLSRVGKRVPGMHVASRY